MVEYHILQRKEKKWEVMLHYTLNFMQIISHLAHLSILLYKCCQHSVRFFAERQ